MSARAHRLAGLLPLALAACMPTAAPPPTVSAPPPPPAVVPPPPRVVDFGIAGDLAQGGLASGTVPPGMTSLSVDGKPVPFAADGRFLIGFGRDHAASVRIEARFADGDMAHQTLAIAPRQWDIQSLPTLPRGTTPTPEFLRRRNAELAQINAARALNSDSEGWRQRFVWPVTGRISGVYGSQRIYAGEPGAPHSGVDVARPAGTPVAAPADGVVVLAAAAPFTLEGNLLIIDHGMGLNSAFLHLSRIDVRIGDRVRQGQPVGAIGTTGRSTGPHLHWAIKLRDERIDPQRLVPPMDE